ncbi:conserved exported hypothetical protein [uncultured Paludibacter sp.]|nr:conserved exported hypothetical protein [uncultured Paludibacter sp.]
MKRPTSFFWCLFGFLQLLNAQNTSSFQVKNDYYTRFQNFSTTDGLSNNSVLGIVQDYNGMMWFATMDGLNRFDGYNFTVYKHESNNPQSLSNSFITCVELDKYGNLWVGTQNGLNRYDRKTNSFIRYFHSEKNQSITNDYIKALLADNDGFLWIETHGAACDRFDIQENKFTHLSHKIGEFEGDYYYHQILKDTKNNVWIGGRCFMPFKIVNGNLNQVINDIPVVGVGFQDINSYVETSDGKIIGFSYEKAVAVYNKNRNVFEKIEGLKLPGNPCRAVIDKKDRIWAGGYEGLQLIDLKNKTMKTFFNQPQNNFSIPSNTVYFVYKDKDENIWLGTNHGIGLYSEKWNFFRHYRQLFDNDKSLSSNHISALMQDKDSLLWVGTEENGVDTVSFINEAFGNIKYNILNQKIDEKTFLRERENLKDYFLRGLIKCTDKNRSSESIFKNYQSFRTAPLAFSSANENAVTTVFQDSRDKIYIGIYSNTGFNCYDKHSKKIKRYALQGFTAPRVLMMYVQDPAGGNWYKQFLEDDKEHLWAVTWEALGLNLFDRDKERFDGKHFYTTRNLRTGVKKIQFDKKHNRFWMCVGECVSYYDFSNNKYHRIGTKLPKNIPNYDTHQRYYPYLKCDLTNLPTDFSVKSFELDNAGNIWLVGMNAIVKMCISDLKTEIYPFQTSKNSGNDNSSDLMTFSDDYRILWFSNGNDFYQMQVNTGKIERLTFKGIDKYNYLHKIGNTIWIGANNGIWIFNTNNSTCRQLEKSHFKDNIQLSEVVKIIEEKNGNIWVGCKEGLIKIFQGKERERYYFNEKGILGSTITDIFIDSRNQLWVGTNNGLVMIKLKNKQLVFFTANSKNKYALIHNHIKAIGEDFENNIWISTEKGFCKYETKNGRFIDLSEPDDDCISSRLGSCLIQDKKGNLWYGTTDKGLNRIDAVTEKITHYSYHEWDGTGISSNNIACLHQDKKGRIWIGTDRGLNFFDESKNKFIHFTTENGLPDNNIMSIQEDGSGNLWISTIKGLCCFNFDTKTSHNFYRTNGLADDEFSAASCVLKNGNLAFGGYNGFLVFNPDSLSKKRNAFSTVLYDFKVNDSLRFTNVENLQKITLKFADNSFTVNFTSSDYAYAKALKYRYKLKGFDKDWIYSDASVRKAKYTNLRWGNYTFFAESSNPFGEFNGKPTEIFIRVKTPWFVSWWFVLLCLGAMIFAVYIIIRRRERKLQTENLRLETTVKQRTAELQETNSKLTESESNLQKALDTKDKFFSIISHDLRNPSRSMSQMADLLYQNFEKLDKTQAADFLRMLSETAKNNNQLIEKLLFWAISQQQDFPAKPIVFEVCEMIQSAIEQVKSDAELKKINIKSIACKPMNVFADRNMMETVLRNLLSNALKYSFEKGEIIISTEEKTDEVEISVTDFGIGMEQSELDKLFKIENKLRKDGTNGEKGTGLGLILCAEFVWKNNGKIFAESTKNQKTIITFTILKESRVKKQDN